MRPNFAALLYPLISLALISCVNTKERNFLPRAYHTQITPLYLENYPNELCKAWIEIPHVSLEDALSRLWLQKGRANFFILGVKKFPITKILVGSEDICAGQSSARDQFYQDLHNIFGHISVGESEFIEFVNTDEKIKSLGLLDFRNSLPVPQPGAEVCISIIGRDKRQSVDDLFIAPDSIYTLRYTLGIPIVYFTTSNDREIFIFDDRCDFRDEYLKLIDAFVR